MKTNITKNIKGQGLIEIILAMGIFALIAASMISLVLGGNAALIQGSEQMQAESLAQEALEAVRAVREGAWNELRFTQSAVATSTGEWVLTGEGTNETLGQYQRVITFSDVCRDVLNNITVCPGAYKDIHAKKVEVVISWQNRPGVNNSISRVAYLSNWDSDDWEQTDWSGGSGQALWSDASKYESDDGYLDYSTPGEIKLAGIGGGGCGVKTWDFSTAGQYIYDADIEIAGGYAQLVPVTMATWWDANYSSRKEISIANAGATVLTDFPVYLKINKEAEMNANFSDLRFFDGPCASMGAVLNYEIESSDSLAANVWVKIPSLLTSANTVCMYYGNSLATSGQNVSGTWDSNYVTVHHLEEASGAIIDSTGLNSGVNNGTVQGAVGIVNGGNYFDSINDDVNLGSNASLQPTNAITFSAWVRSAGAVTQWQAIGGLTSDTSWTNGYGLFFNSANTVSFYVGNYINNVANGAITPANWNYVVGTYDRTAGGTTEVKIYVNGVLAGTDDYSTAINYSGGSLTIGEIGGWTDTWLNGYVDEVRISNIARSADWVKQTYEMIANQNSIVSFSSPEGSATFPTTNPNIYPTGSYSVSDISTWTTFSEMAVKDGTAEIYYQLSGDNGATWYYWNNTSWAVADTTSYNIVSEVNSNISSFATTTAQIMFKAFLVSDGSDRVRLDSLSLGCAKQQDWTFNQVADYSYDAAMIEVSGGATRLVGENGAGATLDGGFNYGVATSVSWPFDVPADYVYDFNKIFVSGGMAQLIGASNKSFRVTEYYLGVGSFSGTSYNLTLNQNLSADYFVILQGSDGAGISTGDRGASYNYASLVSDPWGTGDLNVSTGANTIGLFRNSATNSWVGVATVVECLSDCDTLGFNLLGVERVTHAGTLTTGTDTSAVAWTNINKTMLMGGYNGAGCDTTGTAVGHHKACQNRLYPSGTNVINWARNATGGTLTNAVSSVMVVQWGSEWNVQRVNVAGSAGGNSANATGEYNTAIINSVVRDNTWVWGTGWTAAGGIGNGGEGVLITLGNGVAQNVSETRVAVGAEYATSRSFDVYALTHPNLRVDYRYKADADSASLTYDQVVDVAPDSANRMALVYNGSNGTTTTFPQPMFSARYFANSTVRLERRRSGQNFPAWIQGIDFSAVATPAIYPNGSPDIFPMNSYSLSGIENWSGFTETAVKNGGEIYYQLSTDDGTTWQYWFGSNWVTATDITESNTATVINANISSFPALLDQIKFRAYLVSDGSQLVQLDDIKIDFTQLVSPWTYSDWGVGGGEVNPSGVLEATGGNPSSFASISVPSGSSDELGGYWEQAVTISADNSNVNIDFDYSVLDFGSVPNLAEIRVYLDSSSGNPVNQVGSSINVSGLSGWNQGATINASTVSQSTGTYYLKIALWIESGFSDGPYKVGFDNVVLNWSKNGYSPTSPSIQPNSTYSILNTDVYSGFTESATKSGTSEIYYQLSDDGGITWQYWNGSGWEVAGLTDYNPATIIDSNISSFATSTGSFIFKAFLASNGTDQVELSNVRLSWGETGTGSSGYQIFGSFVSSAFDMGDNSPVQAIEWNETAVASGDIKIQIRTASDFGGTPGVWSDWYGVGGSGTYFLDPSSYLLSTNLNGNRWVQYRAELSGDGTETPVLEKIKINYK